MHEIVVVFGLGEAVVLTVPEADILLAVWAEDASTS